MVKFKIAAALSIAASFACAGAAYAASPAIMKDNLTECAIYLCLPQGFPGDDCKKPLESFILRTTLMTPSGNRIWTDLPDMSFCLASFSSPDAATEKPSSNVSYRGAYEVYMPQINTCTRWESKSYSANNTVRYCAAVKTTPAHMFVSETPKHPYETINVGDTSYSKGFADVKHFTEVLVDGKVTGSRYYN